MAFGLVLMYCSRTPRPTPAAKATGRLLNRASAATANPRMMKSGPKVSGVTVLWLGMISIAANAEIAPASAHDNIDICRGSTPSNVAASGFDAAPRIARP